MLSAWLNDDDDKYAKTMPQGNVSNLKLFLSYTMTNRQEDPVV